MANEASMEMEEELLNSITIKIIHNSENIDALQQFGWSEPLTPVMHRVPDVLRGQNEDVYSPTTVSIGPLHKGKKHLQAMEADKLSYMYFLFNRIPAFQQTQRDCVAAMLRMQNLSQKCFAEVLLEQQVDENVKLAETMLIDGCFLIELLYRNYRRTQDPILWSSFRYYAVKRDLLLLENQIPFFVLGELFRLTVKRIPEERDQPYPTLIDCALLFFGDIMGLQNGTITKYGDHSNRNTSSPPPPPPPPHPHHILHLLHMYYQPEDAWNYKYEEQPGFKYSATQLDVSGIKFGAAKGRVGLFDLNFSDARRRRCLCLWRRGRLEIPPFSINDSTEPFLRNLIAFEKCSPWIQSFFTSHSFLMHILLDTTDDVKLLEEVGIIRNCLGSRKAVLQIFNNICKHPATRQFHYSQLLMEMNNFCKPRQVGLRKLIRHYFGNIWIRVSVTGAILLFVLTFLQTLYTMFSYHHPPSQ